MSKRSQERRITKVSKALRHLRHMSRQSLNEAGRHCNITGSAIAHIEHGRMDIPAARVEILVKAYGSTMEQFNSLLGAEEVPVNKRDECLAIVKRLDDSKVAAVYGLLVNFAS